MFYGSVFNVLDYPQSRDQKCQGQEQALSFRDKSSEWPFIKIGIFSLVPLGLLDLHCFFTSNHFVMLQINRLNYSSVKSNQILQVEMRFFPLTLLNLQKLNQEKAKSRISLTTPFFLLSLQKTNLHALIVNGNILH